MVRLFRDFDRSYIACCDLACGGRDRLRGGSGWRRQAMERKAGGASWGEILAFSSAGADLDY